MSTQKQVIISLFFFLFLVFLPSVSAQACCMLPFPSTSLPNDGIFLPLNDDPDELDCQAFNPNSVFIPDCTDSSGTIRQDIATPQCCFDSQGNILDFNAGTVTIPPNSIYRGFCEYQGFISSPASSTGQCVFSGTQQIMNQVQGTVRLYNSTGPLLSGITVQAQNGILISATTDQNGSFDLGEIPGVDNGQNIFTASAPNPYSIVLNGVQTDLNCQTASVSRQFSGTFSTQTVNIILQCQETGQSCVPSWQIGDWGPCIPFNGEYVQTRSVTDANSCGVTTDIPLQVLTSTTPSPEGDAYSCPLINFGSVCGDGNITGTEQCDRNLFLQPHSGMASTNPVQCSAVGLTGGTLGCSADCGYDYSTCLDPCAVCDDVSKCDTCSSCQGSPLCELSCDELTPEFMDTFAATERTQTRNVLDSYDDNMQNITGIFYDVGTSDVTVLWRYAPNQACLNDLQGYRIYMCEDDGTNTCLPQTSRSFYAGPNTQQTLLQNVLEPNTNYCYNLCTLTVNGAEHCVFAGDANDPLPCFNSGDAYCQETTSPALTCRLDTIGVQQPTGCYYGDEDSQGRMFTNLSFSVSQPTCIPGQTVCVETPYAPENNLYGATCSVQGACELCNGLFGLYANYNLESLYGSTPVSQCTEFMFSPDQPSRRPGPPSTGGDPQVGLCYLDKQIQADEPASYLEQYTSCEQVHSCYDYATQTTCEQDPCFKFSSIEQSNVTNGCSWNTYAGEFGVGVCAPKETTEQECLRCDTDAPTGICDETMCGLYGDCYFKDQQHHNISGGVPAEDRLFRNNFEHLRLLRHDLNEPFLPTCLPSEELTCFFYDSEEDCIGGRPSSLDVTYDSQGNRVAGTHSRTPSNDTYGLGTCKWIDDPLVTGDVGCYKDSDDYYFKQSFGTNLSDDCFDNTLDQNFGGFASQARVDCLYDHEAPQTILSLREAATDSQFYSDTTQAQLPVYGLGELDELQFTVEDNVWAADRLTTHVALVGRAQCEAAGCYPNATNLVPTANLASCQAQDCPIYPRYSLENYTDPDDPLQTANFTNGEYALLYYSEDPARNLELVQTDFIYLDTTGPTLLAPPLINIDTFALGEDIFRSNLTINFSISETAFCSGTLHYAGVNSGIVSGQQHIASRGTSFHASYVFQPDGMYSFNYTCYDDFGNDLVGAINITLDANPSILNPLPQGGLYQNLDDVSLLQITTVSEAQCRFALTNETYADSPGIFQASADSLTHTYDVSSHGASSLGFQTNQSKHYVVYTSCSFTNGTVTELNSADVITFTIDQEPPVVQIETRESSTASWIPYNAANEMWNAQRELQLTCDDSNTALPLDQFGCERIEYCFASPVPPGTFQTSDCATPFFNQTRTEIPLVLDAFHYKNLQLYYRGTDTGGNVGDWQQVNPKLRDLSFNDPQIYFVSS